MNIFRDNESKVTFTGSVEEMNLIVILYHAYLKWKWKYDLPILNDEYPNKCEECGTVALENIITDCEKSLLYPKKC